MNTNRRLIDFHLGLAPDDAGRTRDEVDAFTIKQMEECHDYIQWLFPLPEPSAYCPDAPVMDEEVLDEFRTNEQLKESLWRARNQMRYFYLMCKEWLTPCNHNYLRISRIIRCLALVGLNKDAQDFRYYILAAAKERGVVIPASTARYWLFAEEGLLPSDY